MSSSISKTATIGAFPPDMNNTVLSNPSYQKLQNLLSDCTTQELEWILKSTQLTKECIRDIK